MEKFIERIIKAVSAFYFGMLPESAQIDMEDLFQEGWLVYCQLLREVRYNRKIASFETLFRVSLNRHYLDLVRAEKKFIRRQEDYFSDLDSLIWNPEQEKTAMMFELILSIAEINYGFADMIVHGVPEDLLIQARQVRRLRRHRRGISMIEGKFTIPKYLVEKFFNVNTKTLSRVTYKYI